MQVIVAQRHTVKTQDQKEGGGPWRAFLGCLDSTDSRVWALVTIRRIPVRVPMCSRSLIALIFKFWSYDLEIS